MAAWGALGGRASGWKGGGATRRLVRCAVAVRLFASDVAQGGWVLVIDAQNADGGKLRGVEAVVSAAAPRLPLVKVEV